MKNESETHLMVEFVLQGWASKPTMMLKVDDLYYMSNRSCLESLVGREVRAVNTKDPKEPLLELWRREVAEGRTLVGFNQWKTEGNND